MSFVYLAYHPKQEAMAQEVIRKLESMGAALWIKQERFDWENSEIAASLTRILLSSSVIVLMDETSELDPPHYLQDLITAHRYEKPVFIIHNAREFVLLLPQISRFISRSTRAPLPQLTLITNSDMEGHAFAPLRLRPGWFEIALALILLALIAVILVRL